MKNFSLIKKQIQLMASNSTHVVGAVGARERRITIGDDDAMHFSQPRVVFRIVSPFHLV